MKNWKKYVSLLLALVLCLSLVACGSEESDAVSEVSEEPVSVGIPNTIEGLVLDNSAEHDYSDYMGTWLDEEGNVLTVGEFDDGQVYFWLVDAEDYQIAGGFIGYVEEYHSVYVCNDFDGVAYLSWVYGDEMGIDSFGTFTKVSGDLPGETVGDLDISAEEELEEELPDISGFVGCWKVVDAPYYYIISDACEWAAVNLYSEEYGPGYVVSGGDFITLCLEDGSEVISLWKTDYDYDELVDENGNTLRAVENMLLLPTPDDALSETAYFPDGFSNVSINYPIQIDAHPHPNVSNALSFTAIMEDGTDDYYTNVIIAFQPISGYDSYMEKGAATAEPYMENMLTDFMNTMYGDYLIKSIGSDFADMGDYYSITGYMWLDSSIFSGGDLNQPVRGCMEVRYYGPTGYALVAITIAPESRIQNYFDICNNMLETLSYDVGWSTAPKARPEEPEGLSDSGDYGTPYYWYDEDGDIWYWNGYENEFICFGDDGYIEDGEFYESNDAGWDYDDDYDDYYDYYDDYDPWSDPGDGWDAWSDPGDYDDGWGDYFD